ncbi:MAG TPA: helix-turn-helix domain-containing protein [Nocardioidaceae bacterium]|nr:helix-turn-helix domain-containing protein [Nocardioidaceae bacterium]
MSALLAGRPVVGAATGTVRGAWVTRARGAHRMLPGAGTAIAVTADGTARLYGPQARAWWAEVPGDSDVVGVDVRPGRLIGRLCPDVRDIVDQQVDLADVLSAAERRRFVDAVVAHDDEAERVRALQRETVRVLGMPEPRVAGVERSLWSDPGTTVGALARDAGVSQRQLHRLCTRAFGMSPSELRRLVRLERFLMLTGGSPMTLARMASAAGYFDQQHLARDCRMLADRTPAQLLHTC